MNPLFQYSSMREFPSEAIRYIQYRWTRIKLIQFIPVFVKMVINGIFECFYSFSHQWLVRSYKEDCALLDSFIEKYKKERYQKQRIAIVTGSNTGIGKEIVEALFRAGWYVIMASRSKERAETAIADIIKRHHHDSYNGDIKFIQLDISRYDSICQFVKEFESSHKSLDLLINNAGIYEQLFVPIEGLESQFVTNHLGPFVLTEMLEKFMKPHTRVIQVGSVAQYSVHKIDRRDIDHPILFFPRGGYSLSKALLALSSITLSEKYSKKPVYGKQIFRSCMKLTFK